jgi:hypothetical protein
MDATTAIRLAKIVSDLLIVITMGLPKTDGLTDDEKKAMLANLQTQTGKLVADLNARAARP